MLEAPISFVPLSSPVPDSDIDSFTLLLALDSSGVTLKDFKRLLVSCNKCKDWIGTESAFKAHYCCKCYPTYVELEDGVLDVLSDWIIRDLLNVTPKEFIFSVSNRLTLNLAPNFTCDMLCTYGSRILNNSTFSGPMIELNTFLWSQSAPELNNIRFGA